MTGIESQLRVYRAWCSAGASVPPEGVITLIEAIEAVLYEHRAFEFGTGEDLPPGAPLDKAGCSTCGGLWPCDTTKAIISAMEGNFT